MCLPPRDASTFAADFHQRAHDVIETRHRLLEQQVDVTEGARDVETRTHLACGTKRACVTRTAIAAACTGTLRGVERDARPRTPRLMRQIAVVAPGVVDER